MPFQFLIFCLVQCQIYKPKLELTLEDAKSSTMNSFDSRITVVTVKHLENVDTQQTQYVEDTPIMWDWELTSRNLGTLERVNAFSAEENQDTYRLKISGDKGGLQAGESYCFAIFAAVDDGTSWEDLLSSAEQILTRIDLVQMCIDINSAPSGGTCTIPASPVSQMQQLTIRCSQWNDANPPLRYTAYLYPDCADSTNPHACTSYEELGDLRELSSSSAIAFLQTQVAFVGNHHVRIIISDAFLLATKVTIDLTITNNPSVVEPPELTLPPVIDYDQPEELIEFAFCSPDTEPWEGDSLVSGDRRYGSPIVDSSGAWFPDIIGHEACARVCDSLHGCAYFSAAALNAEKRRTHRCYVYRSCAVTERGSDYFIYRLITQRPTTAIPTYLPSHHPSVIPSAGPIIDPTKAPTLRCHDHPNWHDAGGPEFTCEWYSDGNNRCDNFGSDPNFIYDGLNASRACCVCGREITEFTTTLLPTKWVNTSMPTHVPTSSPTDFRPPLVQSTRFHHSGEGIVITVDLETNLANLPDYFNCDHILAESDIFDFGKNSFCTFLNRTTLIVMLGYDHSLQMGSSVTFRKKYDTGAIRDRFAIRSRDDSSVAVSGSFRIEPSTNTFNSGCISEWSTWYNSGCSGTCKNVTRSRRCFRGFETEEGRCPECYPKLPASISIISYSITEEALTVTFSSINLGSNVALLIVSDRSTAARIMDAANRTELEIGPFRLQNQIFHVTKDSIDFPIKSFRVQARDLVPCVEEIDLKNCMFPYDYIDIESTSPVLRCPDDWTQVGSMFEGNHIEGSSWVNTGFSLEDCKKICDANPECNGFNYGFYDDHYHCARHRERQPNADWDARGSGWIFCSRPEPFRLNEPWCVDDDEYVRDMSGGYECAFLTRVLGCDYQLPYGDTLLDNCALSCLCTEIPTTPPPSIWTHHPQMRAPNATDLILFRGTLEMCQEACISTINCNGFVRRLDLPSFCYLWKNATEDNLVYAELSDVYILLRSHVPYGPSLSIVSISKLRMEELFSVTVNSNGLRGKTLMFRVTSEPHYVFEPAIYNDGFLGSLEDGMQSFFARLPKFAATQFRVYVREFVRCPNYGTPYLDCGYMFDHLNVDILNAYTAPPSFAPSVHPTIFVNQSLFGQKSAVAANQSSAVSAEAIAPPITLFFCFLCAIGYWLKKKRKKKLAEIETWTASALTGDEEFRSTVRSRTEFGNRSSIRFDSWKPNDAELNEVMDDEVHAEENSIHTHLEEWKRKDEGSDSSVRNKDSHLRTGSVYALYDSMRSSISVGVENEEFQNHSHHAYSESMPSGDSSTPISGSLDEEYVE